MHPGLVKSAKNAIALHAVTAADAKNFLSALAKRDAAFLKSAGFSGASGDLKLVPRADGSLGFVVLGLGKGDDALAFAQFSESLPAGTYRIGQVPKKYDMPLALFGFLLGFYNFTRYKTAKAKAAKLVVPAGVDGEEVSRIAEAVFLARDLINTPPNDMGPADLAVAARGLAKKHGAKISVIAGNDLLKKNFPLVHAVGKGSERAPCLIDLMWGNPRAPKVTLVGKGVVFDTGGYDLKSAAGMATMKKDMGGAAVMLAVADMVMGAKLNLRLRLLIPAAENSVSGSAFRPSDVIKSRKGLTVEIGNTDAEGRLILADALAEADSESPELLVDVATLTGAARAATGMELPPFFTDDEQLSADLMSAGTAQQDPLWRLPLWRGYESSLGSSVADLNNNPDYPYAGAITAALFLNRFVTRAKAWAHLDIPAWSDRPRPGRRKGGEANSARALYAMLKARYGK